MPHALPSLGAFVDARGTVFRAWSDTAKTCFVQLYDAKRAVHRRAPMQRDHDGLFEVRIEGVGPGDAYDFVLDDRVLVDPYARSLPFGVDGPAVVSKSDHRFVHDNIRRPLREHVIYELHVGTFTPEGTFAAASERLPYLRELGATAIELLPLAAFSGARGWGYDGVALFAPHAAYGSPDDLKAFIDKAHGHGLAVFHDVVYNHFGPKGNYLPAFSASYFTREHTTIWGESPNFQHPRMRALVLENVRYWLDEFRFDGLRLDAVQAIYDLKSSEHILHEIVRIARSIDPAKIMIAEDDRNDPAIIEKQGFDAVWTDDFHHVMHVLLTGERDGYYRPYAGDAASVARAIEREPTNRLAGSSFVFCIQNHDQIGNRALGDRITDSISTEAYAAASALLLFLPMTPLLFMGQEWGTTAPFQFFTDHDPELGRLVTEGRREEFKKFARFADPELRRQIPDPQANATFERSKLRWSELDNAEHRLVLELYKKWLSLRRTDPVLSTDDRASISAKAVGPLLIVRRWRGDDARILVVNTGKEEHQLSNFNSNFRLMWTTAPRSSRDIFPSWSATLFSADARSI